MRLAAIADLHCSRLPADLLARYLTSIGDGADALLLCGDLTDRGQEDEARALAQTLRTAVRIPILAVLGNHDYEAGKPDTVKAILTDAGVHMLDGEAVEIGGVGFAGAKGFGGGFGPRALQPWGEELMKRFVHEAVEEALRLESALAKLRTSRVVALLHYAPVEDTVKGEPPEIYPFLGSSRLEDPLTRHPVTAVFHGHAHHGAPEGRTRNDAPVYNVAIPLLQRAFPDRPPLRIVEV
ncbi:MAG TPA: metallophosphoesterase [Methylomirabilota bacterium]|nr:metallophosphoesterase [Methylomirabilota bacterium]